MLDCFSVAMWKRRCASGLGWVFARSANDDVKRDAIEIYIERVISQVILQGEYKCAACDFPVEG